MTNTCGFSWRRSSCPPNDCRDRRHRNRPLDDRRRRMIDGDWPRRADLAAARRAVVCGPKSATAARRALLTSRPALVLGDGPPVAVSPADRSAVEPELADRPGLLLFDAHPEIVELPEISILEEVRCTCVINTHIIVLSIFLSRTNKEI